MKAENKALFVIGFLMVIFAYGFSQHDEPTLFNFLTEFSAGLLGVYLAFALDRTVENRKRDHDKKDLLSDIHDELVETRANLTGECNLHFVDIWKSAVSSGQIRLLTSKQIRKLTKIYREIQTINNDVKLLRRYKADYEAFNDYVHSYVNDKYLVLLYRQRNKEIKLCQELDEVLKEEWWN